MKKTIAQQLGVTQFPFEIRDGRDNLIYHERKYGFWERWERNKNFKLIYCENSNGFWAKWEYDEQGHEIYFEDSDSFWRKTKRDDNGNRTYCECSDGFWQTWEMDEAGEVIYSENSKGEIEDNRPKPKPEPTPTITLQHCLDRGFTVEKIKDEIYKKQHGKDYMLCYLKLSKRHMIDYCNATCRCMVYKVDSEGTILERKYLKDVDDLDFYIRFLASEKVLKKLSKLG